ncbi:hypothetical protein RB595_005251 [Gaeumannomyces hyphopodioides]
MMAMRLSRQLGATLSQPLLRPRPCPHTRPGASLLLPYGLVPAATTHAPRGRRHMHLIQGAVETAESLIASLHTVAGTPWYVTIPLVALAVNLTRLPFTVHARRLACRRAALVPLLQAWLSTHAAAGGGADVAYKKLLATERRISRDHGLQVWKYASSLLVFPVWLTAIEAIRRLCGGPTGLLGSLLFKGGDAAAGGGAVAGTAAATAGEQGLADTATWAGLEPAFDPETVTEGLSGAEAAASGSFDASLATGGALWFPDLTAADPYHVLPMLLSAVMFYNVRPKTSADLRAVVAPDKPPPALKGWKGALKRSLVLLALSIGPITMDMPAALHLYWVCSASLGALTTKLVDLALPFPKEIPRCKGKDRMLVMPRRAT